MRLIMISAMYENGGNVTHRHLDGHPALLAYPFESQPGTRFVDDELAAMFPFKYRWPVFPLEGSPESDFELFFDEEYKTRVRRPAGSKFRAAHFDASEDERRREFARAMEGRERTTGNLVMAWFHASFAAWRNCRRSGEERCFVGYSPIIGVDAERIFADLPDAQVLHVVRNPIAGCAETRRRPFPLSLQRYAWTWSLVQHKALYFARRFPERLRIVRYEDLIARKEETMRAVADWLDVPFDPCLLAPTWNGAPLANIQPWGTIEEATEGEQRARRAELDAAERDAIAAIAEPLLAPLGYEAL